MNGKSKFIGDLCDGEQIRELFQIRSRQLRPFRNKPGQYLDLVLGDSTGEIGSRLWEVETHQVEDLAPGVIVRVRAQVSTYKDELQLTLVDMPQIVPEGEYDLGDFLPRTSADMGALVAALWDAVDGIGNVHLKALVDSVLSAPGFAEAFRNAPAAKAHHHAYVGGLLEHTVNVVRLAQAFAQVYPVDADILVAGATLHDIGKVKEYSLTTHVELSDEGAILGHITIGAQMVAEHAAGIQDFPDSLLAVIQHMVLSHHGNLEWGSPVQPKFLEAQLLHYADLVDSKAAMYLEAATAEEDWVWVKGLGRSVASVKAFGY